MATSGALLAKQLDRSTDFVRNRRTSGGILNGPDGTQTRDLSLRKQALSQLSYRPGRSIALHSIWGGPIMRF